MDKIELFKPERIPGRMAGVYASLFSGTKKAHLKELVWHDKDARYFIIKINPGTETVNIIGGGVQIKSFGTHYYLFDMSVFEHSEIMRNGMLIGRGFLALSENEWNWQTERRFRGIIEAQARADVRMAKDDDDFQDPFVVMQRATDNNKTFTDPNAFLEALDDGSNDDD